MAIRNVRRQATVPGFATPGAAPIYVDSDDNKLKMIPAGSGTTEVEIVDASSTQTISGKTLTGATLTTATLTSPVVNGPTGTMAAVLLITTKAVSAAESGTRFFLDLAGGFVTTLPAVALGLEYEFIVKTAPTGSYTIVCPAAAALFKGHVLTNDVNSATDSDFDTTAVATITLVLNKAVAGDRVKVICDGVNWHYRAECSVFDAITGT